MQASQTEDISLNWVVIKKMITNKSNQKQGNLFLGNIWSAKNIKILNDYNINCVLSICDFCDIIYNESDKIVHQIIPAKDEENYDLNADIYKSIEFIDTNLQKNNVLVHCQMGKSRSASIVIAYFMKKYQLNFESAFQKVKELKSDITPNNGFIKLLKQLKFKEHN